MTASTPPAPPRRWPVIDFVDETARRLACSPYTAFIASDSTRSFTSVEVVRVDVADLGAIHLRVPQGLHEGPLRTLAALGGRGDVVRVGGGAVADQLGVNRRAAAPGVPELLEDEHPRPFSEHEAAAVPVEGSRGARGVVVHRLADRLHVREAGDRERFAAGLRASAEHDVGAIRLDVHERLADAVRARGARRRGRPVRRAGCGEG